MTAHKDPRTPAPTAGRAPGRPTLKTISELSGLAVPTVSRALNDAPDIGEATKRRVRELAEKIGYRPNRAGLRLRTGKTNVLALVLPTNDDMLNYTARLITAIAAGTRGTAYHLIITPYFPDQDQMDPVRYLVETRSADGIILNQIEPEDPRVAYLMEQDFPFATHGRTVWCDRHPYVDFDNTVFGRIGATRLMNRGRRRLMLIAPPQDQTYAMNMIEGARAAAEAAGAAFEILDGITSDHPSLEIEAAVTARYARGDRPDGIICASTSAAIAATAGIEAAGLRLGREVDLIGKEAVAFLRRFRPKSLSIHEDVASAGALLTKAVIQAIDNPDLPPIQRLEVPKD
jgi:LacI family transcriptional regulator